MRETLLLRCPDAVAIPGHLLPSIFLSISVCAVSRWSAFATLLRVYGGAPRRRSSAEHSSRWWQGWRWRRWWGFSPAKLAAPRGG